MEFKKPQKTWLFRSLRLAIATTIAVFITQFDLHYLESLTYDIRYQLKPKSPISQQVQTVAIDTKTIEQLGRDPNARDHIELIKKLSQYKPKYIIYVLDLEGVVGSYEELEALAQAAGSVSNFIVAANDIAIRGLENELSLQPPLDKLKVLPGPRTVDKKIFAKDNVTRRFIYSFQGNKTIHPIIASEITGMTDDDYQGVFEFLGSKQAYIDYRPKGTYQPTSVLDVLNERVSPGQFADKVVIVGRDTLSTTKDYIRTPFSREINAMSSLEMHANIFDTLLLNRAPVVISSWVDIFFTILISIITVFVVLRLRPAKGMVILISTLVLFMLFAFLMLANFQLVIPMAHPLVAIFICYYFFIPYRLIMENRKSWEYFHRNKLLSQVEELKSNFLRMMSHDLKTPLARIQGMTEVVLNDPKELSQTQVEALNTIHSSSEELSEFIASILNLGRIESKEIKLQLKSKDINHLLAEVISKLDYLAKRKNIEIIKEFEPMFSIKIDEDLVRQVFTNLIENAIKYSPEGKKILISTEEQNGKIVVQVADQGIGISKPEQKNIFSKFYRSRDVTGGNIKGSGLGLYLANYFVDLHKGHITVESEQNKGSTFSVELPMDLDA